MSRKQWEDRRHGVHGPRTVAHVRTPEEIAGVLREVERRERRFGTCKMADSERVICISKRKEVTTR